MTPGSGRVVFGRYRIESRIGSGGSATVYRAVDELLHQPVALKRIPFAGLNDDRGRETHERALREARLSARLRGHPHVVSVYDVHVDDDHLWLVLEYVPSRSLDDILAERRFLPPGEVARIGRALASALAAAHEQNIVHRDVKPANVLLGRGDQIKLGDFGISHLLGDAHITQTGLVSGTVAYMAPEVARGADSTPAADVFSLGSTLYAALEGIPPFGRGVDGNTRSLMHVVSNGIIRRPATEGPLTDLLLRLLEPSPQSRPDAATIVVMLRTTEPVASEPSPAERDGPTIPTFPTNPGEPTVPRAVTRARVVIGALVAALLLAALLVPVLSDPDVVGGTATSPTLTGAPPLPRDAPAIRSSPQRTVDPCRLVDVAWLRQYGVVEFVTALQFAGCSMTIDRPGGGEVSLDVRFNEFGPSADSLDGEVQEVGDLTVVRDVANDNVDCRHIVVLDDNANLYIDADRDDDPSDLDACAVAETALGVAVARMIAIDDVPRDNQRLNATVLAQANACTALPQDVVLGLVPGIAPEETIAGFGDWSCYWYTATAEEVLSIVFGQESLDTPAPEEGYVQIAGLNGSIESESDNDSVDCYATVELKRGQEPDGVVELIEVEVDAVGTVDEVCARTRSVIEALVPRLPR